jgi:sugar lactone lactonase YvrE
MDMNEDGDALDEGEISVWASGFHLAVDLAFDADGHLYVVQMLTNGFGAFNPADPATLAGSVVRVNEDGSHTIVSPEGLIAPGGLAITDDGWVYVSNMSVMPAGQLVRFMLDHSAE